MTNGIKAIEFSDMVNTVTIDYPITSYSSNPFENPNFYHPYQYTPHPTPLHQYTPPQTPPHVYHHIQPAEPPHQFYTTTYLPHIPPTSMLISDITKGYLHHLDDKVNKLDAKLAQISLLIDEKNRVADLPNLVDEGVFEEDIEAYQVPISSPDNDIWHKMEDKITEIIQTMEKMRENYASPSKLAIVNVVGRVVEPSEESIQSNEMSLKLVCESSHTLTHVSVVNNQEDLCRVEIIVDDNSEDLKQLQVLTPAKYVPEVFVASPETDSIVFPVEQNKELMNIDFFYHITRYDKILMYKLYENEYGKAHGEFYVNFKNMVNATQLFDLSSGTECDKFMFYKLREDERGKVEVLVESNKHVCDSELLDKGLNVPFKCSYSDDILCNSVCLDSILCLLDKVHVKDEISGMIFSCKFAGF